MPIGLEIETQDLDIFFDRFLAIEIRAAIVWPILHLLYKVLVRRFAKLGRIQPEIGTEGDVPMAVERP